MLAAGSAGTGRIALVEVGAAALRPEHPHTPTSAWPGSDVHTRDIRGTASFIARARGKAQVDEM